MRYSRGSEQRVPALEEHEHRQHRDAGPRERQHDAAEHVELGCPVDLRGLAKLDREIEEERPHQEDPQRQAEPLDARDPGQDHGQRRSDESHVVELVEQRDHDREERDHQADDEQEEHGCPPREVQARQAVAGGDGQDDHPQDGRARDPDGVQEEVAELALDPGVGEVLEGRRREQAERIPAGVGGLLEGRGHDQHQRKRRERREDRQGRVDDHPVDPKAPPAHAAHVRFRSRMRTNTRAATNDRTVISRATVAP